MKSNIETIETELNSKIYRLSSDVKDIHTTLKLIKDEIREIFVSLTKIEAYILSDKRLKEMINNSVAQQLLAEKKAQSNT